MDPRGYPYGPEPAAPQYYPQRPASRADYPDRDAYYSSRPGHYGDMYYPHPDSREKHWTPADHRPRPHVTSPPPRTDVTPVYQSNPVFRAGYGPDQPLGLAHSRHGYDYPRQNYPAWDPREDYGYYDRGYHKGHRRHPEADRWTPNIPQQDYWRQPPSQDRRYEQDWASPHYIEPQSKRYDPFSESSQYDYGTQANFQSPNGDSAQENGDSFAELSLYESGGLARAKASGLSSSGYELSQYIDSTEPSDLPPQSLWSSAYTESAEVPQLAAPLKFSLPHVRVGFGPGGQLLRVSPSLPTQGEPALVEIHSLEVILVDTREQEEVRAFPGPLTREDLHKVDAISFAQNRADRCLTDEALQDKASAALLWNLLVLLCRQNGRIVGSDIAEQLLRDHRAPGQCAGELGDPGTASLIDLSEEGTVMGGSLDTTDLLTGEITHGTESREEALGKYTKLLLSGRKKEALEAAMGSGLWGHALFLASKMDNRSYTTVLNRFTGSLAVNDPLQTLFQLLSGRIPAVSTCCGSERWGDWKPHLAVILSNPTGDVELNQRAITTMGDTLATRGLIDAAHVCYLMARVPFGVYTVKSEKLVLLGSNHCLPFLQFTKNAAIQCTEVFEYCQLLGDPFFLIPSFQVYKFIYACRLLDYGLASQAFHYCEVIGKALLKQDVLPAVLVGELIKLAQRLKLSDPLFSDGAVEGQTGDPKWLAQLQLRHLNPQMGNNGWCNRDQPPADERTAPQEENGISTDHTVRDQMFLTGAMTPELPRPGPDVQYLQPLTVADGHWQQPPPPWTQEYPADPPQTAAAPSPPGAHGYPFQVPDATYPHTSALDSISSDQWPQGIEMQSGNMTSDMHVSQAGPDPDGQSEARLQTAVEQHGGKPQEQGKSEDNAKSGWFGWFKSKPAAKTENKESRKDDLKDTDNVSWDTSAPPLLSPPPRPPALSQAAGPPPPQPGVNPFSRWAGRQSTS
ncbi:protein transport protein Sec16B isoform X2 [Amia ocellicauda]|uniref:protein transport protein Sec16B isoform X2 n=1 Tax=Amia ocellicauda TaxID=2972642 RepID=UPI003464324F